MNALVLDCDGVLADTERFGHLPAFNQTFEEFGLPVRWSEEEYGRRLLIGGGKERMASLLTDAFVREVGLPADPGEQQAMLATWHKRKTAIYTDMVHAGALPARPGITRVITAALDRGWGVAVASTSAAASVRAVVEHVVAADLAGGVRIYAGDLVPRKKPDPAIYRLVVEDMGLRTAETLAVEDSHNGLAAAVGAGLRCVITVSSYTTGEDFGAAVLVVSSLGDPGDPPITVLANRGAARPEAYVVVEDLEACLS